jgi:predicted RNA-binding protein YlqC (UPF0109 family)
MSSIDQQFIEYIVKSLVNNPDAVKVERTIDEKGVLLELTVDPEDLGRVIGKRGATAQSLRTLLRALGTKNDARYNLKIVDVGGDERPARPPRQVDDAVVQDVPAADDSAVADDTTTAADDDLADLKDDDDADEDDKKSSSRLDKTRQELAELDDLDV